ncbi:hypothetical protein NDU88_004958 [Pleurodeles waltl]|uniref:Uncharacterized protein n=1 Tax=Pleurodeles waltl TaxID=8319 RepID=A0AAV7LSI3_PLEWA|nr:hypothetical protein NDU88_004958 [Pleurodeles waltl]
MRARVLCEQYMEHKGVVQVKRVCKLVLHARFARSRGLQIGGLVCERSKVPLPVGGRLPALPLCRLVILLRARSHQEPAEAVGEALMARHTCERGELPCLQSSHRLAILSRIRAAFWRF